MFTWRKSRAKGIARQLQSKLNTVALVPMGKLTLDKEILEMVKGVDTDVTEQPVQGKPSQCHQFSKEQRKATD